LIHEEGIQDQLFWEQDQKPEIRNPKLEIRNKFKNQKRKWKTVLRVFLFLLGILNLFRISAFGFFT